MSVEMKINNNALSVYGAELVSYSVDSCDYDDGYIFPPSATFPIVTKGKIGLRKIVFVLDFSGSDRETIEQNIRNAKLQLMQECELLLPDNYLYKVVYKSSSEPKEVAPWICQVKFTMLGVRHGTLSSATLTQSGTVNNTGDLEAPAILSITTTGTVTVAGITITGQSGTIIIDGYKKTVKNGNNNVFSSTNLTAFPKLAPGNNTISIDGSCTVVVSYYPLYL